MPDDKAIREFKDIRFFLPRVFGMSHLFPETPTNSAIDPIDPTKDKTGFPKGSTILISGPPGSGKTVVALAIVRDLLCQVSRRSSEPDGGNQPGNPHVRGVLGSAVPSSESDTGFSANSCLFYISPELTREKLQQQFKQFGWFSDDPRDSVFSPERVYVPDIPESQLARPVQSAQDLINLSFARLRPYRDLPDDAGAFIIVDSLTALLKDSRNAGDRRRETHEFITRLRQEIPEKQLGLVFLLSEQPRAAQGEVPTEEYVSEFVLNVYLKQISDGRRQRTIEVTKSHGAKMSLGEHSWAIITRDGADRQDPIVEESLRDQIRTTIATLESRGCAADEKKRNTPPPTDRKWATIAVFRRPRIRGNKKEQPPNGNDKRPNGKEARQNGKRNEPRRLWSGTNGLDEMLCGDQQYWAQPDMRSPGRSLCLGIRRGGTTLLLGPSGSGKTTMCLQFLFANAYTWGKEDSGLGEANPGERARVEEMVKQLNKDAKDNKVLDVTLRNMAVAWGRTLYVNFETESEQMEGDFPAEGLVPKLFFRSWRCLYRTCADLDVNLLMSEVNHVIETGRIERVAIDGLSDLLKTIEPREYSRFVENLLGSMKQGREHPITTFVTFEMEPKFEILPPTEGLSVTADNVVVLRPLPITDELRRTVYILKARGLGPDRQVRELITEHQTGSDGPGLWRPPVTIQSTLESYTGLLGGQPIPLAVTLQLFAENEAEYEFNKRLKDRLSDLFGYAVKTFGFSRTEMTRTLQDAASPTGRIPKPDVKVLSLDEWWIREFDSLGSDQDSHPLLRLDPFFGSARGGTPLSHHTRLSDFWLSEIEKASVVRRPSGTEASGERRVRELLTTTEAENGEQSSNVKGNLDFQLLGVPNYTDFGLFCFNPDAGCRLTSINVREWKDALRFLPRVWVRRRGSDFLPPDPESGSTLVDLMAAAVQDGARADAGEPVYGFVFDMETLETAVCTFLEFCWAFGAGEDFLIRDLDEYLEAKQAQKEREYVATHSLTDALRFLQYMVIHGLLPPRCKISDSRRALFARHWYSTLPGREVVSGTPPSDQTIDNNAPRPPQAAGSGVSDTRRAVSPRPGSVCHISCGAADGQVRARCLVPLPFFPLGATGDELHAESKLSLERAAAIVQCFADIHVRLKRLVERFHAALTDRSGPETTPADPPTDPMSGRAGFRDANEGGTPGQEPPPEPVAVRAARAVLADARRHIDFWDATVKECRKKVKEVKESPTGPAKLHHDACQMVDRCLHSLSTIAKRLRDVAPQVFPATFPDGEQATRHAVADAAYRAAAESMDLDDVLELLRRHDLRVKMLRAELNGQTLKDVVEDKGPAPGPARESNLSGPVRALTGYCCTGSWMVGVHRAAHSPSVSWQFIEEITSLRSAYDRSRAGAGIPSRKDFYRFYGDEKVPAVDHLTWSELLSFAGCRARRRDRVLCRGIQVSEISETIYREMLHCLMIAEEYGDPDDKNSDAKKTCEDAAFESAQGIFESVLQKMKDAFRDEDFEDDERLPRPCLNCLSQRKCFLSARP